MSAEQQKKQSEWHEQWSMLQDDELFLFKDWIYPNTLEREFAGATVLECGSGGGQHTSFIAPFAKSVTAVDLNCSDITRQRVAKFNNVKCIEADIATMDLKEQFDIVFSIGVVHHTDSPDATIANLLRHVKPGGRLIVWVYSEEGNGLVRYVVEPLRKLFLKRLSRPRLWQLTKVITALMYIPIYSVYLLPLTFLPFYEYFGNFRKMSFERNALNVFDKLNAPQVEFISGARARGWFSQEHFSSSWVTPYMGVSWRASGVKK